MSIPHLFRCPISLDLFTDPVTLCTGQTYDRPSIETWLVSGGNSTCPVTMQRLHDTSLVPNRTLRHLIDQWLLSVPGLNSTHQATAAHAENRAAFASSLCSLKQSLQSPETPTPVKIEVLKKVRVLSTESDIASSCLVQLCYFPLLLQLLLLQSLNYELVEVCLDCVLILSGSARLDALNVIKKETNLASFLELLEIGNLKIKTSLCCLLETIAAAQSTQQLCLILGQSQRAMQVVISLLHDQTDTRSAEAAVRAISGLCSIEGNRRNAIREGAVDGLVSYVGNSNAKNYTVALATLEVLASLDAGKKALIRNSSAVRVLVKSVFRFSSSKDDGGGEHAVGALLIMCCESAKVRTEAVNAGVLSQVLLLLQCQCGNKAKAKGRALLKLLRSMWGRDPSVRANCYLVM